MFDRCTFVSPFCAQPQTPQPNETQLHSAWTIHAVGTYSTSPTLCAPDFYNEPYKNPIGWFANQGQLINENGQPRNDIKFSSVGCVPKACLAENSQVYFLTYEHGAAPSDPVTVMQVSMKPVGKARRVNPQGVAVKDCYQNFYLPQTAGRANLADAASRPGLYLVRVTGDRYQGAGRFINVQ